jgi:hypothetical protein
MIAAENQMLGNTGKTIGPVSRPFRKIDVTEA